MRYFHGSRSHPTCDPRAAIEAEITEQGAGSMKDMGKVIGGLRGKYAGRMDFGKASGVVTEMLSG